MQQFIRKIGVILLTTVLLLCLFDWAYTEVYVRSIPRNKTKYVLGLKDQKIDYVFLGSSRVENHIDTQLIKTLTSKKVLNLGIQGAKLDDNYLLLQLLIHNNVKIGKLFLQVDYIFNTELYIDDKLVESPQLPASFTTRRYELCWKYDLPKAKHTVRLKIINPSTEEEFRSYEAIIYSDHPSPGIKANEKASKVDKQPK